MRKFLNNPIVFYTLALTVAILCGKLISWATYNL